MGIGGMPDWLKDFFGFADIFKLASAGWNFFMKIVLAMMGKTPETYSPEAWRYVSGTLYPWFLSIGLVMLNIFCMIGFIRQASNLRDNVTMEMWIELFIKTIVANVLMANGLQLMKDFFSAASLLSADIMIKEVPKVFTKEVDAGALLMYELIGVLYVIASCVCGAMILLEVMGRFINLYLLAAVAPVALSTWAGGRGLENTAYAWIKSFLTNVFQIVVIALILQIGSKMIQSSGFVDMTKTPLDWFDGAGAVMQSFITMIFLTAAVKGADNFLKRAFELR